MAEPGASVSLKSFNKWPFKDDFEFKAEQGRVVWVKCKFCSLLNRETYLNEAKRKGLKITVLTGPVRYH